MKTETIYWQALKKAQQTRQISIRKIAAKIRRSPGYVSRIFAGKIHCPERIIRQIASALFTETAEQEIFVTRALGEDDRLYHGRRFTVSIVPYGFLAREDAKRKVTLSGKSHLSGPSGLLVDCFGRVMHMMGQEGLGEELKRTPLEKLIAGRPRPSGELVLSHLAALNMIGTSYFFCTPVSIGVSAVLFFRHLKGARERKSVMDQLRTSQLRKDCEERDRLQLICMEREVGHYFARSLFPTSEKQVFATIDEFTIDGCCRALESASSRLQRIPVLVADELTCYHVLNQLSADAALLFGAEVEVPRFYFGFSISRNDHELRKELDRATELYLKSDSQFIVERYCEMYRQLFTFAVSLRDCFGAAWSRDQCRIWADQVCGFDQYATDSALISNAWRRILDHVKLLTREELRTTDTPPEPPVQEKQR